MAKTAAALIPPTASLAEVAAAARSCTACPLHECGTQTVFGEGPSPASLLLVGEQPGDREDLAGRPFVGPAGGLLDRALAAAGIDRADAYLTNVVKHFKWRPAGKRRIHQKPNAAEVTACRPWLDRELELVQPSVVVLLGATAAQALLGRSFRVTQSRGHLMEWDRAPLALATVHPSSILRAPDAAARERETAAFIADLRVAAGALGGTG